MLVVQEIFGVHEHIRDVTRRLAKLGYLAIAPELFARQGDRGQVQPMSQLLMQDVVAKVSDAQVMADLDAAVAWAAKNGGGGKVGITGFCWGGRTVWMYAAHNRGLGAGVAWYGPVSRAATSRETSRRNRCGGGDQGAGAGAVRWRRRRHPERHAGQSAGRAKGGWQHPSEIVVYPDTPHAFHADYRPSYRKEQAEDGWKRLTAWFRQYLA